MTSTPVMSSGTTSNHRRAKNLGRCLSVPRPKPQGWDDVTVEPDFEQDGYAVLRRAVEPTRVQAALRLLNLAIRRHGLTAEEIETCQQATFFPHLRWEPEVWAVLPDDAASV